MDNPQTELPRVPPALWFSDRPASHSSADEQLPGRRPKIVKAVDGCLVNPAKETTSRRSEKRFYGYKAAQLDRDAGAAASFSSTETLDYYEDMRRLAVTGDPKR